MTNFAYRIMLCLATLLALPGATGGVLPSHEVAIQYGRGGPGPDRDHISWTVTVQQLADKKAFYYWSMMVYFNHAPRDAGAYTGIQPNDDRSVDVLMGAPVTYANGVQYRPEPSGTPLLSPPCNAFTKVVPAGTAYLVQTGTPIAK